MYEHHTEPLIPRSEFAKRLLKSFLVSLAIIFGSLIIGMIGYRVTEGLSWIDAFLNASMLMGGMGPVDVMHTDAGKLFAGFYALYSGLVLLIAVGVLGAPLYHRFQHRFHLETDEDQDKDK
ncbi:MAG TPA: hypothetical protein VFF70_14000 [Anaerolineae bacterium]|nr:hypothetical protein [Anaerolineae bacterium]